MLLVSLGCKSQASFFFKLLQQLKILQSNKGEYHSVTYNYTGFTGQTRSNKGGNNPKSLLLETLTNVALNRGRKAAQNPVQTTAHF